MIDREDMLELTRRMTPARSSVGRVAGAYFDAEGYVDGTFNTNFRKLSVADQTKNLAIAKTVPFSRTNEQLKDYAVSRKLRRPGSLWQLLDGLKGCGLKNDALLDVLYEVIGEQYQPGYPYAFYLFHGSYDVPVKGTDREWMEGSEEVYTYLIGVICPVSGDYEAGKPEYGFLYPVFRGRSSDPEHINIFEELPEHPHRELTAWMLGG
ncbi:MAG: DUF4317 domain-containing protein [Clostridiales bacterium]|nr:DUF4317 domain-containing protein [Clostridiales bacterium]